MLRGKRPFHPSIQVQSLPDTWCLLLPHPPSSSDNLTLLTHPPVIISASLQEVFFFCSKHTHFISNLMLPPLAYPGQERKIEAAFNLLDMLQAGF